MSRGRRGLKLPGGPSVRPDAAASRVIAVGTSRHAVPITSPFSFLALSSAHSAQVSSVLRIRCEGEWLYVTPRMYTEKGVLTSAFWVDRLNRVDQIGKRPVCEGVAWSLLCDKSGYNARAHSLAGVTRTGAYSCIVSCLRALGLDFTDSPVVRDSVVGSDTPFELEREADIELSAEAMFRLMNATFCALDLTRALLQPAIEVWPGAAPRLGLGDCPTYALRCWGGAGAPVVAFFPPEEGMRFYTMPEWDVVIHGRGHEILYQAASLPSPQMFDSFGLGKWRNIVTQYRFYMKSRAGAIPVTEAMAALATDVDAKCAEIASLIGMAKVATHSVAASHICAVLDWAWKTCSRVIDALCSLDDIQGKLLLLPEMHLSGPLTAGSLATRIVAEVHELRAMVSVLPRKLVTTCMPLPMVEAFMSMLDEEEEPSTARAYVSVRGGRGTVTVRRGMEEELPPGERFYTYVPMASGLPSHDAVVAKLPACPGRISLVFNGVTKYPDDEADVFCDSFLVVSAGPKWSDVTIKMLLWHDEYAAEIDCMNGFTVELRPGRYSIRNVLINGQPVKFSFSIFAR